MEYRTGKLKIIRIEIPYVFSFVDRGEFSLFISDRQLLKFEKTPALLRVHLSATPTINAESVHVSIESPVAERASGAGTARAPDRPGR
jgi:hypothetical protein